MNIYEFNVNHNLHTWIFAKFERIKSYEKYPKYNTHCDIWRTKQIPI